MRVESLRLRDFRNLREVDLDLDPRFNVIVGPNGQGKTNLLESVYFLAALKSFRSLTNAALIRHEAEEARCAAWVDRGGMRREVVVDFKPRGRKVRLNGNAVRRLSDFFGVVNTVAFVPEDVTILKDGPAQRRTFIDRAIFNAHPAYAEEMSQYETALKHRNALIRDGEVRDRALLGVYDAQLVQTAVKVIQRRCAFIDRMRAPFASCFAEIFGEGFDPEIRYALRFASDRPDHDALLADPTALAEALTEALNARFRRDLARGHTTVGPHRDDIEASLSGQPMREFASQGQHRAFVLALKITEIRLLHDHLGHPPILLLDDVSSELDPVRNERLFDFLSTVEGQVFITTTDADFVRLSHPYTRWNVRAGQVTP